MRKNIKKIISLSLFVALMIWIGFYIKNHWIDFIIIKSVFWKYIFILFALGLSSLLVQGYLLKIILESFKIRLTFYQCFGIMTLTLLGNYIFPFGGFGFRAAFLKKVYGFRYLHFLSTLITIYILEFFVYSLGGLIGLASWYHQTHSIDYKLTIFFIIILTICSIFMFFPLKLPDFKNRFYVKFTNLIKGFYKFKGNLRLMGKLLGIVLIEFCLFSAIFYFSYHAFHLKISFLNSMISSSFSIYSLLIRLTPASFGFYEGTIIYTTKLLNLSLANGLLIALITRLVNLVWVLILGPLFGYFLLIRKK